jgi:hypothetical protein
VGKRSNFERNPRDFYPTPKEALAPLFPHLSKDSKIWEPCAGDGRMVRNLQEAEFSVPIMSDIHPICPGISRLDAMQITPAMADVYEIDLFVTNPPWDRKILHSLIGRLPHIRPTWLLFDAGWMHTAQAANFLIYCHKIVSVGRVRWIENTDMSSMEDCCWYLFDRDTVESTAFFGKHRHLPKLI